MKSVKLNKTIKEDIINSMMSAWESNNPCKFDINKEEEKLGDLIWKRYYKQYNLEDIPKSMLRLDNTVVICINTNNYNYNMSKQMPVKKSNHWSQIPCKVFESKPAFIKEFEEKQKVHYKWASDKDTFKEEIEQIVNSVNTTKQLVELWPEAEQYIPPYANDPSKGITLPALKTSRLNELLGVK